ncbi:hypothetical protein IRP63_14065 (plasmid) [Clostridium botulinum]|uniref:Uncharacterized protein n=1 Tax=Clostridium botulinum C/D str. DC5 TaxID=1443128 RepID=A0A0A0HYH1_CLOBO|nr:hypothetical protein [Clostridium botulinum]KGM93577.1 hypothetical protein Z955_14750 [Clostridium botulinum C/D str. DC5]KOC56880.1 hypothetical protein ADU89_01405 [Clostridium botulinum]KOC57355.1 hypothetical protein ADU90_05945 [Clostridium botulinum]MCD3232588.1 hypothetical protein [Clostridium botulinum D/C]MCD3238483.1 hypothetical protein [Clostridium botulinum D/C]
MGKILSKELIINGVEKREIEFEIMNNKLNGTSTTLSDYRNIVLRKRKLENELQLREFEENFNNKDMDKLKCNFEILDLIHKTNLTVNRILHIMQLNNWTIKDIYKEYEKGYTHNILTLISKPNRNVC